MEVRYVPYAIANNFGTHIELNQNLKKWPDLHDAILEHELSHTNKEGFTKEDLIVDLKPTKVNNWRMFKFIINNPKSLLQFMPVYLKEGTIFYDLNMIVIWGIMFLAMGATIYFSL
jgi:hypothetical protein